MKTLGIIGFGSFGQFMAKHLEPYFDVTAFDKHKSIGDLDEVCACEVVVLAVPVQFMEEVLVKISSKLKPGTLFFDVGSVKVKPVELMLRYLPDNVQLLKNTINKWRMFRG